MSRRKPMEIENLDRDDLTGRIAREVMGFSERRIEQLPLPYYSSEMRDAWEVVHRLSARGFSYSLHEPKPGVWRAAFTERSCTRPMPSVAESDNAAEATCLAALQALVVPA